MPENSQNSIKVKINLPQFNEPSLQVIYIIHLIHGNDCRTLLGGTNVDNLPDETNFNLVKGSTLTVSFIPISKDAIEVSFDITIGNDHEIKYHTTLNDSIKTLQHTFN